MGNQYMLAECQWFPKNYTPWNVYITARKVYFIPIDKQSRELKRLNAMYMVVNRYVVGSLAGVILSLIFIVPREVIKPKMAAARRRVLDRLRSISVDDLEQLEGHSCLRSAVRFEERRGGNYRVYFGKAWVLIDGASARDLRRLLV